MKYLTLCVCLLAVVGCSQGLTTEEKNPAQETGKVFTDVIYGEDNRVDLYQVADPTLWALADSTVALVEASDLSVNAEGKYLLAGNTIGQAYNLCKTEPFYSQQVGAFCSGFLVGPDTLVTAGHCIQNASECKSTKFAFGFAIKSLGQKYNEFAPEDIVGCKSVVHTQAPSNGADYAVVKLDRPILHHAPLKLAGKTEMPVGESIFVVGHPSGLPTKIAGGANVRSNDKPGFFVANLDTYGGNSGSAVFNSKTLEVEGILVRGETDYVMQNGCRISKKCADSACRGEDVTRISSVLPHLARVRRR